MSRPKLFRVAALSLLFITGLKASDESAEESLEAFSFSFPGGLSRYSDNYELSPPRALMISRRFTFRPGEPARTCTYEVPQCEEGDAVTVCDVQAAVSDHHVRALWPEEGEKGYGRDPRPQDGVVFTIEAQSRGRLTVGDLCRDESVACSEEHEDLIRLRRVFTDLSRQAQSSPECAVLEQ